MVFGVSRVTDSVLSLRPEDGGSQRGKGTGYNRRSSLGKPPGRDRPQQLFPQSHPNLPLRRHRSQRRHTRPECFLSRRQTSLGPLQSRGQGVRDGSGRLGRRGNTVSDIPDYRRSDILPPSLRSVGIVDGRTDRRSSFIVQGSILPWVSGRLSTSPPLLFSLCLSPSVSIVTVLSVSRPGTSISAFTSLLLSLPLPLPSLTLFCLYLSLHLY